MSSDYRILCMNHDPAIVIDHDWNTAAEAIAVACDPASHELIAPHAKCDLLVGRYSYPLVEICCPPRKVDGPHATYVHAEPKWLAVEWLKILIAAKAADQTPRLKDAIYRAQMCWTHARVERLRSELRVDE